MKKPSKKFPNHQLKYIKEAVVEKLKGDTKVADTYTIPSYIGDSTLLRFKRLNGKLIVSVSKFTAGVRPKKTFVGRFDAKDILNGKIKSKKLIRSRKIRKSRKY
jgi:hypothetical protein